MNFLLVVLFSFLTFTSCEYFAKKKQNCTDVKKEYLFRVVDQSNFISYRNFCSFKTDLKTVDKKTFKFFKDLLKRADLELSGVDLDKVQYRLKDDNNIISFDKLPQDFLNELTNYFLYK